MAFVGVELKKNEALEKWVATVMEGFANANMSQLGILASEFEIVEASHITTPDKRMFLVNAKWNLSSAMWIIGFFGGAVAYAAFGKAWILTISLISAGSAYVFSSSFLRFAIRFGLRKHKYRHKPVFLNAEEILRKVGTKRIAQTMEIKD